MEHVFLPDNRFEQFAAALYKARSQDNDRVFIGEPIDTAEQTARNEAEHPNVLLGRGRKIRDVLFWPLSLREEVAAAKWE